MSSVVSGSAAKRQFRNRANTIDKTLWQHLSTSDSVISDFVGHFQRIFVKQNAIRDTKESNDRKGMRDRRMASLRAIRAIDKLSKLTKRVYN